MTATINGRCPGCGSPLMNDETFMFYDTVENFVRDMDEKYPGRRTPAAAKQNTIHKTPIPVCIMCGKVVKKK